MDAKPVSGCGHVPTTLLQSIDDASLLGRRRLRCFVGDVRPCSAVPILALFLTTINLAYFVVKNIAVPGLIAPADFGTPKDSSVITLPVWPCVLNRGSDRLGPSGRRHGPPEMARLTRSGRHQFGSQTLVSYRRTNVIMCFTTSWYSCAADGPRLVTELFILSASFRYSV